MTERRRYALVGTGARSQMYIGALATTYRDRAQLVGLCDVNATRLAYAARRYEELAGVEATTSEPSCCGPDEFTSMLEAQGADEVIVTSIDRTHHRYIVAAMEVGRDVICEKPLTVDATKCAAILDAQRRTGQRLRVTFNYRYAPRNSDFARLLRERAVGTPISVHFEWLLDTVHGADYFRRWHRDKRNSGGLMVHKASHHFDLVNWWLGAVPVLVFGLGDLRFYGKENAEQRGISDFYERGPGPPQGDPFGLDLSADPDLKALYLDAEADDGYLRDRSVFSDGISIEDDMAVLVRYNTGATMSYHLTAYAPWEGYRVMVNGTEGRLELDVEERSYVSGHASAGRGEGRTRPDPSEAVGKTREYRNSRCRRRGSRWRRPPLARGHFRGSTGRPPGESGRAHRRGVGPAYRCRRQPLICHPPARGPGRTVAGNSTFTRGGYGLGAGVGLDGVPEYV